jgi:hypothetical protein
MAYKMSAALRDGSMIFGPWDPGLDFEKLADLSKAAAGIKAELPYLLRHRIGSGSAWGR